MFIFTECPEFQAEVEVMWPEDGVFTRQTFTGRFRLSPDTDLMDPPSADTAQEFREGRIKQFREVFLGWVEGTVTEEDGTPIPVTQETLRNMLRHAPIQIGIARAYATAITGGGLRRGNSPTSLPASGAAAAEPDKTT